jgi:hypothetical protein
VAVTRQASADLGRRWAVVTGLVLVESAAVTGQASADRGRRWAVATGPEWEVSGAVTRLVRLLSRGRVTGRELADQGLHWVAAIGLALAELAAVIGPALAVQGAIARASAALVPWPVVAIARRGAAIAQAFRTGIGPDGLAIARDTRGELARSPAVRGQEPEEVANGGRAAEIGRHGLAIVLDSRAGTVALLAATGLDGLAIGPESARATSVPAMSDRLATTSES